MLFRSLSKEILLKILDHFPSLSDIKNDGVILNKEDYNLLHDTKLFPKIKKTTSLTSFLLSLETIKRYKKACSNNEISETHFYSNITNIIKEFNKSISYKNNNKVCFYQDAEQKVLKTRESLIEHLGTLKEHTNNRHAQIGRELTNQIRSDAPPLIQGIDEATEKRIYNDIISYIAKDVSPSARYLMYVLYEVRKQLEKKDKTGFLIKEEQIARLLGLPYQTRDEKKDTQNKIDIAIDELTKDIEIKDPKTGAYIKGALLTRVITKGKKGDQRTYKIVFHHPVWQNNFIKINTKYLTSVLENVRGIKNKNTREQLLSIAEQISIEEAEGKKEYSLDKISLEELKKSNTSWNIKKRRDNLIKNLNTLPNKTVGIVGKKIVVK